MRKRYVNLAIVATMMVSLVACGSDNNTANNESGSNVAVTQESSSVQKPTEAPTEKQCKVKTVTFTTKHAANYNIYGSMTASDKDGAVIWTKDTKEYQDSQFPLVGEIGISGDKYYYVENNSVIALDLDTGNQLWANTEFGSAYYKSQITPDGNIYVNGSFGFPIFGVTPDGKTICRIQKLENSNIHVLGKMEYLGDGKFKVTGYDSTASSDKIETTIDINQYK